MRNSRLNRQITTDNGQVFIYTITVMAFGLIMLSSSSLEIADRLFGQPYYYLIRQITYLLIGMTLSWVVFQINFDFLMKISTQLVVAGLLLLFVVLFVGKEVNGSTRWLSFAGINIQVSEMFKLLLILYLSSYIVRKEEKIKNEITGLLPPMIIISAASILLLLEPDFGASFVIVSTSLAMFFVAGVRIKYFAAVVMAALVALISLVVLSPYRFQRLISFLDPWSDPFNSGFQLSQALIAIGRGELTGVGLGSSIQKMFYLPEAHTDFVYSVIGEEIGLIGTVGLLAVFIYIVIQILNIGNRAEVLGRKSEAFFCYGYGFWLGIQVLINIGVNIGVLPTKGLTLPFISYGGSSLIVFMLGLALVYKVYSNNKIGQSGVY